MKNMISKNNTPLLVLCDKYGLHPNKSKTDMLLIQNITYLAQCQIGVCGIPYCFGWIGHIGPYSYVLSVDVHKNDLDYDFFGNETMSVIDSILKDAPGESSIHDWAHILSVVCWKLSCRNNAKYDSSVRDIEEIVGNLFPHLLHTVGKEGLARSFSVAKNMPSHQLRIKHSHML